MTETPPTVYQDCKKLEETYEGAELQLKIAELVADKYLHLFTPTKLDIENNSHKKWLNTWADLLSNDTVRRSQVLIQLDKFSKGAEDMVKMFNGEVQEEWE